LLVPGSKLSVSPLSKATLARVTRLNELSDRDLHTNLIHLVHGDTRWTCVTIRTPQFFQNQNHRFPLERAFHNTLGQLDSHFQDAPAPISGHRILFFAGTLSTPAIQRCLLVNESLRPFLATNALSTYGVVGPQVFTPALPYMLSGFAVKDHPLNPSYIIMLSLAGNFWCRCCYT